VRDVLASWRDKGYAVQGPQYAYIPRVPMVQLITRGIFRSVYMWPSATRLSRRSRQADRAFDATFGLDLAAAAVGDNPVVPRGVARLTASSVDMVAAALLDCYRTLPDAAQQHRHAAVAEAVHCLTDVSDSLRGNPTFSGARKRVRMAAETVINTILLSSHLHGAEHLTSALRDAIKLVLPGKLGEPLLESLQHSGGMPVRQSVQGYFFTLDAALCKEEQRQTRIGLTSDAPSVECVLSDSSPRLGVDWQMTESFKCADAVRVYDLCRELQRVRQDAVDIAHGHGSGGLEQDDDYDAEYVPDSRAEASRRYQSLTRELHKLFTHHQFTALGMGSQATAAGDKLHALIHQFRLASPSMAEAQMRSQRVLAFCSDLGTESALHSALPADLSQAFPHWLGVRAEDDDGRAAPAAPAGPQSAAAAAPDLAGIADDDGAAAPPAADAMFADEMDFEEDGGARAAAGSPDGGNMDAADDNGMAVAGVLHICNNGLNDVIKALEHEQWYIDRCKPLVKLLADEWTRNRLLERCFSSEGARQHHASIKAVTTKPTEWRFGSWIPALVQLQYCEVGLRHYWDLASYNSRSGALDVGGGGGGAEADPQRPRAETAAPNSREELKLVNEAINSPAFWAYGHMVLLVTHGILFEFQNWCESCVCHDTDFRYKPGFSAARPYFARRSDYGTETGARHAPCPLRGRRAPEVAAGKAMHLLRELAGQSLGALVMRTAALQPADRTMVVREFERCRTARMEVMESQLGHWTRLPHRLCALGCTSAAGSCQDPARDAVRSCIDMYAALTDEQRHGLWPLVAQVCDPPSPSWGEVQSFIGGAPLDDLPNLKRMAGSMQCIPICERSIESRHRHNELNTSRAPSAGGAFVNVMLKLPGMVRQLKYDPQMFLRLATTVGEVRKSPEKIARMFDLQGHHTLTAPAARNGAFTRGLLAIVFY
ncbi:unnamed protein product, partial [Prorocentrum cordatum]